MVAIPQQALLSLPKSSGDPFLSSVALLMGFEGANGSTGAPGMSDEGPAAHGTATVSGAGATISTAQFAFGTSSLSLNNGGTSQSQISFPSSAAWAIGTKHFTIECMVRVNSLTAGVQCLAGVWGSAPNLGWILYVNNAAIAFNDSTTGSDNNTDLSGGTLVVNTWYAACVDYDGTKYRLYLNGAMVASSLTARNIFNPASPLTIGGASGLYLGGFIDELRFTLGVARYASDGGYTVQTAAFPRS